MKPEEEEEEEEEDRLRGRLQLRFGGPLGLTPNQCRTDPIIQKMVEDCLAGGIIRIDSKTNFVTCLNG